MMNNEEGQRDAQPPRGTPYHQGRKPVAPKYQENRFSPSQGYNSQGYNSYNYQNAGGNYQGGGYGAHQQRTGAAGSRRPPGPGQQDPRFRREQVNYSERIMKQNDLIIRILKEIRDRLPAPPVTATPSHDADVESVNHSAHIDNAEHAGAAADERHEGAADAAPDQAATMTAPAEPTPPEAPEQAADGE